MTPKKVYYLMTFLLVSAISTAGVGTYLGNNLLQKKSNELMQLKIDSELINEQQKALIQAKKDIAKYEDLQKIAKSVVPQEKDQAKTVRELVKIAEDKGIKISSITFPSSNLGAPAPRAPAPDESSGGSAESAAPTPAPTTTTTTTTTQVKPVSGIPGVFEMEIQVQSDTKTPVSYEKLLSFLRGLEQNRRTAQVTNISVTPSASDRTLVSFNLTVNVYIKP